jgi:hypothetical protein
MGMRFYDREKEIELLKKARKVKGKEGLDEVYDLRDLEELLGNA